MINQNIIIISSIFIALVIIQIILKIRKPIRRTIIHTFLGVLSLLLLNISSYLTGLFLPINFISLGISAVAGIPGITLLLALNFITQ